MYQKVPLTLTGPQLRKLSLGHPVQLKAEQLQPANKHTMVVHPETAKKMRAACIKGRGCRIQCSPQEIEMSGEGLADIWNWLKTNVPKAVKWVSDNVIQSEPYQTYVRPKLHELGESALSGKPYANYTVPGFNYLSEKTGAFGVKQRKAPKQITTVSVPKPTRKSEGIFKAKTAKKRNTSGGSFRI